MKRYHLQLLWNFGSNLQLWNPKVDKTILVFSYLIWLVHSTKHVGTTEHLLPAQSSLMLLPLHHQLHLQTTASASFFIFIFWWHTYSALPAKGFLFHVSVISVRWFKRVLDNLITVQAKLQEWRQLLLAIMDGTSGSAAAQVTYWLSVGLLTILLQCQGLERKTDPHKTNPLGKPHDCQFLPTHTFPCSQVNTVSPTVPLTAFLHCWRCTCLQAKNIYFFRFHIDFKFLDCFTYGLVRFRHKITFGSG